MAKNCGLRHDSCDGTYWGNRLASYVPDWTFLSENVAENSVSEFQVLAAWQRSPLHNANLVHTRPKYFGSGYAVRTTSTGAVIGYWTQDFADTKKVPAIVPCSLPVGAPLFWYGQLRPRMEANLTTPLCLDSIAGRTGPLRAQNCVSPLARNQVINIQPIDATGSFYRLYFPFSDLCFDLTGLNTANGAPVGLWNCGTNAQNQHFRLLPNGALQARLGGKCLELSGNKIHAPGTWVTQWTCTGGNNQIFVRV
ncbi:hypothetical protein HDU96_005876 [Phlyctochytrium bullatum]|nr:hypothetical protein HDU96_005876 [Phlyctochytrium bullatum]